MYIIKRCERGKREPIITIPNVRKQGRKTKIYAAVIFYLSRREVSEVALDEKKVKFRIKPRVTYEATKATPIISPYIKWPYIL